MACSNRGIFGATALFTGLSLSLGCGTEGPITLADSSSGTPATDDSTSGPPPTTSPTATDTVTTGPSPSDSSVGVDSSDGDTTNGGESAGTTCGNGMIETGENCDDGNADDGDGCSSACTIDEGWLCDGSIPSVCTTICGDGVVGAPAETCDDGNAIDTDECTATCQVATCGDGSLWEGNEVCDDGNAVDGDGCSADCMTEAGFACVSDPPLCFPAVFFADGAGGFTGNLYAASYDGALTTTVGPIGVPITGMAFHPNGTLYAVTSTQAGDASQLGRINPLTAEFTVIGSLIEADGTEHPQVPDITFMGEQLFGWTENADDLVLIDTLTAEVTPIDTARDSFGTGLAYNSDTDELLVAPAGSSNNLYVVDELGIVTEGPVLGGTQQVVKGMAYLDGLLYGLDLDNGGGGFGNFVTYDPVTGAASILASSPSTSIDALAVFDPNNLP